jgi:hypothetical protein
MYACKAMIAYIPVTVITAADPAAATLSNRSIATAYLLTETDGRWRILGYPGSDCARV